MSEVEKKRNKDEEEMVDLEFEVDEETEILLNKLQESYPEMTREEIIVDALERFLNEDN